MKEALTIQLQKWQERIVQLENQIKNFNPYLGGDFQENLERFQSWKEEKLVLRCVFIGMEKGEEERLNFFTEVKNKALAEKKVLQDELNKIKPLEVETDRKILEEIDLQESKIRMNNSLYSRSTEILRLLA